MAKTKRSTKKEAFLKAYARCGIISKAAESAKIHRHSHYLWLKDDPEYPARFEEAQERAIERMEEEADRRALEGVDEPVFYKGELCGTKRRYSDLLLIFRLKALRPEVYRERVEHSGIVGTNVKAKVIEDDDWYCNAHRLAAPPNGSSGNGANGSGKTQVHRMRKAVGKNGNGAAGNGKRPGV